MLISIWIWSGHASASIISSYTAFATLSLCLVLSCRISHAYDTSAQTLHGTCSSISCVLNFERQVSLLDSSFGFFDCGCEPAHYTKGGCFFVSQLKLLRTTGLAGGFPVQKAAAVPSKIPPLCVYTLLKVYDKSERFPDLYHSGRVRIFMTWSEWNYRIQENPVIPTVTDIQVSNIYTKMP